MILKANNLSELENVAQTFLNSFQSPKTIAFYGTMGTGKTTFIKALCQVLKTTDVVNSPTFSIVNEYLREEGSSIFHFDLYRLESPSELSDIGFEDYLDSGNWCFIEWPELSEPYFDNKVIKAYLEKDDNNILSIRFDV